jgi:hypothetical protein
MAWTQDGTFSCKQYMNRRDGSDNFFLNVKKNQKNVDRYFGMLKTIFTTIHNHNVLQWNMIIIFKYF